jgi:hypothetical protein
MLLSPFAAMLKRILLEKEPLLPVAGADLAFFESWGHEFCTKLVSFRLSVGT